MARCYNSDLQAQDEAFLAQLKLQLAAAQATYLEMLSTQIDMYRLDAGEGQQTVRDKDLESFAINMDRLKRMIDFYERKLNGCGIVNMALRRRRYR